MLRNERYRGVQVWNRSEKVLNPETGRKVSRARPKDQWVRIEVPEWRIIPESLKPLTLESRTSIARALLGSVG